MFKPSLLTDTPHVKTRSDLSRAFETLWRNLPRGAGLIPQRAAFRPELRDLIDTDVTGLDYLDLVPDREYQAGHLRLCVETPCAAWSLSPVIYDRGYTSLVEITHFPLTDEKTGVHTGLLLINEIGAQDPETRTIGGPFEMKPAVTKQFIDIGAGVPG